ncbi:hypothetical protein HDU98_010219 [Podochytrium sp. JEL0797]|nr:hypothetical protein HDU98_010219 [Podochytrium sp. JEL0797]
MKKWMEIPYDKRVVTRQGKHITEKELGDTLKASCGCLFVKEGQVNDFGTHVLRTTGIGIISIQRNSNPVNVKQDSRIKNDVTLYRYAKDSATRQHTEEAVKINRLLDVYQPSYFDKSNGPIHDRHEQLTLEILLNGFQQTNAECREPCKIFQIVSSWTDERHHLALFRNEAGALATALSAFESADTPGALAALEVKLSATLGHLKEAKLASGLTEMLATPPIGRPKKETENLLPVRDTSHEDAKDANIFIDMMFELFEMIEVLPRSAVEQLPERYREIQGAVFGRRAADTVWGNGFE